MIEKKKRLIDANVLIARFKEHRALLVYSWAEFKKAPLHIKARVDELDICIADAINAPAVDAVPVRHGQWVVCGDGEYVPFTCSACGKTTSWYHKQTANFCPNCGAKMDGGTANDQ